MSMRVNTIVTHLRPEDAYTLIEFLDQVRDVLMQSYADDMKTMLQEASTGGRRNVKENDPPF